MQKLVRALGMLLKIRYHVQEAELKHIYYTIFQSHLRYGCQVWYQSNSKTMREKIEILQKKALRIMYYSDSGEPSLPLFKEWKILNSKDIADIQNCLFVHSFLKGKLSKWFENFCKKCSNIHINPTRFSSSECLYLPPSKSVTYGMKSITNHCIYSWNTLTENLNKPSTHPITTVMCNDFIANY